MKMRAHDRLIHRDRLRAEVECKTAIHVGQGRAFHASASSDLPQLRTSDASPYLPGASFRGALRAGLESLLLGLGTRFICDPLHRTRDENCAAKIHRERQALVGLPDEEEALTIAWKHSCDLCRIFGNTFLASRLHIGDLRLISPKHEALIMVRDGVGIDRDLRTAKHKGLFDFEAIAPGARFELRMEIENLFDRELGLILIGLDLFTQGFLSMGGKRARGLGHLSLRNLELHRQTPTDFFNGSRGQPFQAEQLEHFRLRARETYGKESPN